MPPDLLAPVDCLLKGDGTLDDVERMLQDGADPNQQDGKGKLTPLRCALKAQHKPLLQLLLNKGANANLQDNKGVGPLHLAAFDGDGDCVQALLDADADANILDKHGQTPLFFASTAQVCELLIKGGADVNARNSKHQTPMHLAAHAGFHDIVKLFAEKSDKESLNVQDKSGYTPFYYAARAGVKKTINVLQSKGASMTMHVPAEALEVAKPPKPPIQAQKQVICEMKWGNLDLAVLALDPVFKAFTRAIKEALLDEVSVDVPAIEVELRGGSSKVRAAITPPLDMTASSLMSKLKSAEAASQLLSKRLGVEVSSIDSIDQFAKGVIFIASMHIFVQDQKKIAALSLDLAPPKTFPQPANADAEAEAPTTRMSAAAPPPGPAAPPEAQLDDPGWGGLSPEGEAQATVTLAELDPELAAAVEEAEREGELAAVELSPEEEAEARQSILEMVPDLALLPQAEQRRLASFFFAPAEAPEARASVAAAPPGAAPEGDDDQMGRPASVFLPGEAPASGMSMAPPPSYLAVDPEDEQARRAPSVYGTAYSLAEEAPVSRTSTLAPPEAEQAMRAPSVHGTAYSLAEGAPVSRTSTLAPPEVEQAMRSPSVHGTAYSLAEGAPVSRTSTLALPEAEQAMRSPSVHGTAYSVAEEAPVSRTSTLAPPDVERARRSPSVRSTTGATQGETPVSRTGTLAPPEAEQSRRSPSVHSTARSEVASARMSGLAHSETEQARRSPSLHSTARSEVASARMSGLAPSETEQARRSPSLHSTARSEASSSRMSSKALSEAEQAMRSPSVHGTGGAAQGEASAARISITPAPENLALDSEAEQAPRSTSKYSSGSVGQSPMNSARLSEASSEGSGLQVAKATRLSLLMKSARRSQTRKSRTSSKLGVTVEVADEGGKQDCNQWEVVLEKSSEGEEFGFAQIDGKAEFEKRSAGMLQGPEMLIVFGIKEGGLLDRWNTVHPSQQVAAQDRIISINGQVTISGMREAVESSKITMQISRYPEHFSVTLQRGTRPLGFSYAPSEGASVEELRILEVAPGLTLADHNAEAVSQGRWWLAVLPGMSIQGVNDLSGDKNLLMEELKRGDTTTTLHLRRGERALANQDKMQAKIRAIAGFRTAKALVPSAAGSSRETSAKAGDPAEGPAPPPMPLPPQQLSTSAGSEVLDQAAPLGLRDAGRSGPDVRAQQPGTERQIPGAWEVTLEPTRGDYGLAFVDGNRVLHKLVGDTLPAPEVLIVDSIREGGPLQHWNAQHPEAAVLPGDRIFSVNGEATSQGMQKALKTKKIVMTLARYPDEFTIQLDRQGMPLGFDFVPNSGKSGLQITELFGDGVVHNHNVKQIELGCWDKVVLPHMHIVRVDNIVGNPTQIVKGLLTSKVVVNVTVQRFTLQELSASEEKALQAVKWESTVASSGTGRSPKEATEERKRPIVADDGVSPAQSRLGKPPLGLRLFQGSGGLRSQDAATTMGPTTSSSGSSPAKAATKSSEGTLGYPALGTAARWPTLMRKEERNGCEYWQVLLEKRQEGDQYGFATINGRLEFQRRSGGAFLGPETLVVWRIKEDGLLAAWNRENPEAEVLPQDRIVNVNSEITIEGMQTEIRTKRILMKVMRYPSRFSVSLERQGLSLGCRYEAVEAAKVQEMKVMEISKEGALHKYNTEQADIGLWHFIVLPDMRIETVNGVTGNVEKMIEALKANKEQVQLVVRRGERMKARLKQVQGKMKLLTKVGLLSKASPSAASRGSSPLAASSGAIPEGRGSRVSAASSHAESRVGDDCPGTYILTERAVVAPRIVPCAQEDIVTELDVGTVIKVVQVALLADIDRVRARLEKPPGWISLVDTESGFRWAEREESGDPQAASHRASQISAVAAVERSRMVVLYDFDPSSVPTSRKEDLLLAKPGDQIQVLCDGRGDWISCHIVGEPERIGRFPKNHAISLEEYAEMTEAYEASSNRAAGPPGTVRLSDPPAEEMGMKEQESKASRPQTASSEVKPSSCCLGF